MKLSARSKKPTNKLSFLCTVPFENSARNCTTAVKARQSRKKIPGNVTLHPVGMLCDVKTSDTLQKIPAVFDGGKFIFDKRLIIFSIDLEESLRVEADGAKVGGFRANDNMSAISALPNSDARFFEDFLRLDVL